MTTTPSPEDRGLHGLHSTSWVNVRKALRLLGGHEHRTTGNHNSILYKMPGGYTIAVGKAKASRDQLASVALQQLMSQIVDAHIEPYLFLAVLDRVGCSWTRRPSAVGRLAKWLRSEQRPLRTASQQRAAIREFSRSLAAPEDADPPEPESETPAAPPARTAFEKDRAAERAAAPEPGRTGTGSDRFTFTVGDVLDLTGLEGAVRLKASKYATGAMNSRSSVPGRLIREGHAARLPRPKGVKGHGTLNAFTEAGAMTLAQELIRRYGPPEAPAAAEPATEEPAPAEPATAEPATETPSADETASPTPTPKPPPAAGTKSVSATRRGTATPAPPPAPQPAPVPDPAATVELPPAEPPEHGAALLALCRHHGTDPVWCGFALNVPATIQQLARAAAERTTP